MADLLPESSDPESWYLWPGTVPVTVLELPGGERQELVPKSALMAMQADRDAYRRACALINGWRVDPGRTESQLVRLLLSVGMDSGDAHAVLGIVRQARSGELTRGLDREGGT